MQNMLRGIPRLGREFLSRMNRYPSHLLYLLSLIFVSLPLLIFQLGVLHWYYAIPLSMCLLIFCQKMIMEDKEEQLTGPQKKSRSPFTSDRLIVYFLSFIFIFIWVYYSGVGPYGFQNGDFQKHNAMLNDLINQEWPVTYRTGMEEPQSPDTIKLVYYLAYYLPAAIIGKLTSPSMGNHFIFLWALAGVLLSFGWFLKLVGRKNPGLVIFFIFWGGMDFLGNLCIHQKLAQGTEHIEWWSEFWQYSANSSLLYWVPQHALAGWIITGLIIHELLKDEEKRGKNLIFLFSLSSLWSPFVMLGLMPFLLLFLTRGRWKNLLNYRNAFGLVTLALMGLYYHSRFPDSFKGFLWDQQNLFQIWPRLVLFYLLEFGLYSFFCYSWTATHERKLLPIFNTALISLIFIPFYKFGMYNDFVMRSSIPSLFIVQVMVAQFLTKAKQEHLALKKILFVGLFIAAMTSGQEILRAVRFRDSLTFPSKSIVELDPPFATQYLGHEDSFFFQYLAKSPTPNVTVPYMLRDSSIFTRQFR